MKLIEDDMAEKKKDSRRCANSWITKLYWRRNNGSKIGRVHTDDGDDHSILNLVNGKEDHELCNRTGDRHRNEEKRFGIKNGKGENEWIGVIHQLPTGGHQLVDSFLGNSLAKILVMTTTCKTYFVAWRIHGRVYAASNWSTQFCKRANVEIEERWNCSF